MSLFNSRAVALCTFAILISLYNGVKKSQSRMKLEVHPNTKSSLLPRNQKLHILSYNNNWRCSGNAPKKAKSCDTRAQIFCNCLRVNLQILDGPINYLGDNEKDEYPVGHIKKILDTYQYLLHFSKQYNVTQQQYSIIVLFVDAFDVAFQRDESYIIDQFLELKRQPNMQGKVIWQAEHECSPGHPKNVNRTIYCNPDTDAYPPQPKDSDARYLNAGVWIGYLYDVIANFRQFMDFIEESQMIEKDDVRGDQEIISQVFINRSQYMTLDYYSHISQAMIKMYGEQGKEKMVLKDGGWYHPKMHNYPALIHFNGRKDRILDYVNKMSSVLLNDAGKKVDGDLQIKRTNYNESRWVKYREICGQFKNWYD